jgi:hypothetical protein
MADMDSDPRSEAYDKLDDLSPDSSGRQCLLNRRTKVMLDIANQKLGFDLVVIQGSYMLPSQVADQSEHTHDGGGVIDLRTRDIPPNIGTQRAVRALREVGFAAFHRRHPPFTEDHIHAVAIGDVQMDPSAKDQVDQYFAGLNGLGGDDTDPQVRPIPIFDYDTQGLDMQLTDKIPGTDGKTVGDALKAALKGERQIERLHQAEARRAQRLAERDKKVLERIAAATQAVEKLPEGATKQEVKSLLQDIDATVTLVVEEPDAGDGDTP